MFNFAMSWFRVLVVLFVLDFVIGDYYDTNEPLRKIAKYEPVTAAGGTYSTDNLNCDDFPLHVKKCVDVANNIYNKSRKYPPWPSQLKNWCKSIKTLTLCSVKWNNECRDEAESHFNQESVEGHVYLVKKVCDDLHFEEAYQDSEPCINSTFKEWSNCYSSFKKSLAQEKDSTREWTHFITHFHMCCARMAFRSCTYHTYYLNNNGNNNCSEKNKLQLQKLSVIISDSDVQQLDCDFNMEYKRCPNGDPRPKEMVMAYANQFINEINAATFCEINLYVFVILFGSMFYYIKP